jgi:hypothetical protein
MIKGVKGTNVWFSASDRHAIHPFPEMPNVAWRGDWVERQVIQFVESVLGIATWATSIAGLNAEVADARKSVSSGHFGLFAVVTALGESPSPLSSKVIQPVQLFHECSVFLRTGAYSTLPPRCPVITAHHVIMGLCELVQGQWKRERADHFCFFLPRDVDWSILISTQQARFASTRVISESLCRDVLAFSENEAKFLMNFPWSIAFAICFPPSAMLTTDSISAQIDAHFGFSFDYCKKCRCWHRIPFITGVKESRN